jgi:hypothetical protein
MADHVVVAFRGRTRAGVPDSNGRIYPRDTLVHIRDHINAHAAAIPIVCGYEDVQEGTIPKEKVIGVVTEATIDGEGLLMLTARFLPADPSWEEVLKPDRFTLGASYLVPDACAIAVSIGEDGRPTRVIPPGVTPLAFVPMADEKTFKELSAAPSADRPAGSSPCA